jgi:hypothetical protein
MKFRFPSLIIAVMLVTACQGPSDATGLSRGEMDPASPAPFLTGIPTSIGNDRSASLGETVRYDNGVEITMTSLGWHPTNSGEPGAIEGQLAEFEITVFNGGKEPFNAALLSAPIVTYGRDNTPTNVARDQSYKPVRSYFGVIPVGEKQSIHVNRGLPSAAAGEVQVQLLGPDYGKLFFKGALSSHKMYWDGTTVK